MSNDRLKFRAWDNTDNKMMDWEQVKPMLNWCLDRYEVMQWTGLYDNTGTKIYEGDRVVWGEDAVETVYFEDGMYRTETSCLDADGASVMAVIGNIYDA